MTYEFRRALFSDEPIHFCHGGKFIIARCARCRRAEKKAKAQEKPQEATQ